MKPGYSLLEVLIAIALIALATGLAAPALIGGMDRQKSRLALSAMEAGLTGLRYDAVLSAAPVEISEDDIALHFEALPEGWRILTETPIRISAGGVCEEGALVLASPEDRRWHRRVTMPDCNLQPL